jgi:hypothetical protein
MVRDFFNQLKLCSSPVRPLRGSKRSGHRLGRYNDDSWTEEFLTSGYVWFVLGRICIITCIFRNEAAIICSHKPVVVSVSSGLVTDAQGDDSEFRHIGDGAKARPDD